MNSQHDTPASEPMTVREIDTALTEIDLSLGSLDARLADAKLDWAAVERRLFDHVADVERRLLDHLASHYGPPRPEPD